MNSLRTRSFVLCKFLVAHCAALAFLSHAVAQQATQPEHRAELAVHATPLRFTLTYDPQVTQSFTGRVYVMLSTHHMGEPRLGPSWFSTDPFFAMDVKDWKPDAPLIVGGRVDAFPVPISQVPKKEYSIQAVMRINPDSPRIGDGEGTAYSAVLKQTIDGESQGNVSLRIDQVVPQPAADSRRAFRESDRIKLVELRSDLLSQFHQRDIIMRAAVVLPKKYAEHSDWTYPALYWIGGFGSDHRSAGFMTPMWDQTGFAERIVRVVLDPLCFGGHHVFADSDNNGPRGTALVQEFIPYIESKYRLAPHQNARFLSGHSSGGWSSLWLQVAYPEFFGGAWSIAPDPIDFRDFQRINLYAPGANMYIDPAGERRPLARFNGKVALWYDTFAMMDAVHGEGGQLRSFEWVFSRRGSDGKPQPLYDRRSGDIDRAVAESWKRFDINLILQQNWPTLGPQLNNGRKLNIIAGEFDNFYLEGAVQLVKQTLADLKSDAVVEIVPGKDHSSVATQHLRKRIDEELVALFERHHPEQARPRAFD